MDIFGQPDWLGLAGGIFGEIVGGLVQLLNWLALLLPFLLAGWVHGLFKSKNVPGWVAFIPAVLMFGVVLSAYYYAYPYLSFPLWMRWFH